eukprot:jgi/Hompol1/3236/HPOL_006422-RA
MQRRSQSGSRRHRLREPSAVQLAAISSHHRPGAELSALISPSSAISPSDSYEYSVQGSDAAGGIGGGNKLDRVTSHQLEHISHKLEYVSPQLPELQSPLLHIETNLASPPTTPPVELHLELVKLMVAKHAGPCFAGILLNSSLIDFNKPLLMHAAKAIAQRFVRPPKGEPLFNEGDSECSTALEFARSAAMQPASYSALCGLLLAALWAY